MQKDVHFCILTTAVLLCLYNRLQSADFRLTRTPFPQDVLLPHQQIQGWNQGQSDIGW